MAMLASCGGDDDTDPADVEAACIEAAHSIREYRDAQQDGAAPGDDVVERLRCAGENVGGTVGDAIAEAADAAADVPVDEVGSLAFAVSWFEFRAAAADAGATCLDVLGDDASDDVVAALLSAL